MLLGLDKIIGYTITASDGKIGKVNDFLFDDQQKVIRYLVADTGNWLYDRLVLISPYSLGNLNIDEKEISVNLTKKLVENSPLIGNDKPVSLQHEQKLAEYYQWPIYWGSAGMAPGVVIPAVFPPVESEIERVNKPVTGDSHLRSTNEVLKYDVTAFNEKIGSLMDIIIDNKNWTLKYLAVKIKESLFSNKKVLCAVDWINNFDYKKADLEVNLSKENLKDSPEYDPSLPIYREYEELLYDYYGRPKYWI